MYNVLRQSKISIFFLFILTIFSLRSLQGNPMQNGRAALENNDYGRAIVYFSEAIRLDPNNAWLYNNRGFAYSRQGNFARAIADFGEALRLNSNDSWTHGARGQAYLITGDNGRTVLELLEIGRFSITH